MTSNGIDATICDEREEVRIDILEEMRLKHQYCLEDASLFLSNFVSYFLYLEFVIGGVCRLSTALYEITTSRVSNLATQGECCRSRYQCPEVSVPAHP
jgi:hypothetical protein